MESGVTTDTEPNERNSEKSTSRDGDAVAVLLAGLGLSGAVNLGNTVALSGALGSELVPGGGKALAVAAPGSVAKNNRLEDKAGRQLELSE